MDRPSNVRRARSFQGQRKDRVSAAHDAGKTGKLHENSEIKNKKEKFKNNS
jgi:hypothetical protein